MYKSLLFAVLLAGLLAPIAAEAQNVGSDTLSPFRVELKEARNGYRGPGIEGYVYNSLPWRIANVRLRVESVDPSGRVTGEAYGWALGDVPAGGRAYFFVPVSAPGAAYRAAVESFDKVSLEAP